MFCRIYSEEGKVWKNFAKVEIDGMLTRRLVLKTWNVTLRKIWKFCGYLMTELTTVTFRINVQYMLLVVRPIDFPLLHFKVREK
jgi:hypothetical protein